MLLKSAVTVTVPGDARVLGDGFDLRTPAAGLVTTLVTAHGASMTVKGTPATNAPPELMVNGRLPEVHPDGPRVVTVVPGPVPRVVTRDVVPSGW